MPFSGGTYTGLVNSFNDAVSGEIIDPADWNAMFSDLETALNALASGAALIGLHVEATTTPYDSDPQTGYFGNFKNRAAIHLELAQSEVQTGESGGIRQALAVMHDDNDGTDYQSIPYRTITEGIRAGAFGKNDGAGTYAPSYKDLHGVTALAIGRTEWAERGTAAFLGDSIQFGTGVCLGGELTVLNPAGAANQSGQIAGWLINLAAKQAPADTSHVVYGVLVQQMGKLATAAFSANSIGTDGDPGTYATLLHGALATVTTAGIAMPQSASGNVGTYIFYDTGDYSQYDRSGNAFGWAIAAVNRLWMDILALYPATNDGLALGYPTLAFSDVFLASGAVINFNNGDVTVTHSANTLAFAGGSNGYSFDADVSLATNRLTAGTVDLGNAADTTLSRSSAGVLAVEGVDVLLNGGALGTPSSGTATNLTGLPFTGISGAVAWVAYTPTISSTVAGTQSYTTTARYAVVGKTCFLSIDILINSVTSGSGGVIVTFPGGITANSTGFVGGREDGGTGVMVQGKITSGATSVTLFKYDNSATVVAGYSLLCGGSFEIQ